MFEGVDIINYYEDIKNKLIDTEIYAKVKDYYKERHRVITYYEVGKMLYEAGSEYGKNIIGEYSKKLMIEVGKKYNERTLRSMRQLYLTPDFDIWKPPVSKLNWTHCLVLLAIKDKNKRDYYINQVVSRRLSKRTLQEIKN